MVTKLEAENELLKAELANFQAELEPLRAMAAEFNQMEPKMAAMRDEVQQKDDQMALLQTQQRGMEELKMKVMSYDAVKKKNEQLENLTTALSEEKQEAVSTAEGFRTELGKANEEIDSLLAKLEEKKHELALARSGKKGDPKDAEAKARLGWVNKIQRAAFSSKMDESKLLRENVTHLTRQLEDDEARLAKAKAEAVAAANRAERHERDLKAQFLKMAKQRDAEFESEGHHIEHLQECCEKLEDYAMKEHKKWKDEHVSRVKLQRQLADMQNSHNEKAALAHSLHDQLREAEAMAQAAIEK
jgi:hypothetical protein